MIDLADFGPHAAEAIAYQRDGLRSGEGDVAAMHGRRLVLTCRAAATAALFLDYDPAAYEEWMVQAGAARAYLLGHVAPDFEHAARFFKTTEPGFVDALACQSWEAARQIGAADFAWRPHYEYEEDYLYHQLLRDVVVRRDEALAATRLDGIDRVRQGSPWARRDVGEALLAADADAFDEAFRDLLDEWEGEVEFWRTSLGRDDVVFMTDEHLFVEGLGVLQVARAIGVEIREAYRFCPAEALALPPPAAPGPLTFE